MFQLRPAVTTNVAAYTNPANTTTIISAIYVTNSSNSTRNFRLFHDISGASDFDEDTALFWDVSVPKNTSIQILDKPMALDTAQSIELRSSSANALTFTAYGAVITP